MPGASVILRLTTAFEGQRSTQQPDNVILVTEGAQADGTWRAGA